jgi:hypothetical protein
VPTRDDRRALLAQPLQGGQDGGDAQIVLDPAVPQRDVEVCPQQDPRPVPGGTGSWAARW